MNRSEKASNALLLIFNMKDFLGLYVGFVGPEQASNGLKRLQKDMAQGPTFDFKNQLFNPVQNPLTPFAKSAYQHHTSVTQKASEGTSSLFESLGRCVTA